MSIVDLRRLWKLHEIDAAMVQARARVQKLDIGQEEMAELKNLLPQVESQTKRLKELTQESKDIELRQADMKAKAAKFEKDLYGGKIVNPREVEAYEKEIVMLKRQASDLDNRLLELMEEIPTVESEANAIEGKANTLKKMILKKRSDATKMQAELKTKYDNLAKLRPDKVNDIPVPLLSRYDLIRKTHGGIGMAEVKKDKSCEACGTLQADKVITLLLDGQTVICENCKRILYYTEGVL